jgi:hypothetical protein
VPDGRWLMPEKANTVQRPTWTLRAWNEVLFLGFI